MCRASALNHRLPSQIRSEPRNAIFSIACFFLLFITNANAQRDSTKPFLSPHSANPPAAQFSRATEEKERTNAAIRAQRDQRWRGVAPIPLEDPGTNGESGAGNVAVTYVNVLGPPPEALPVRTSELVAIGHVTSARGFITPDNTGVYSEFSITVDRVLKGNQTFSQATVVGIRRGGQVHFPSGHTTDFLFSGVGFPKQGPSYLFFLHQEQGSTDFEMVTAYELSGTKVYAIDSVDPFIQFDGADEGSFLATLDANIAYDRAARGPLEGERAR